MQLFSLKMTSMCLPLKQELKIVMDRMLVIENLLMVLLSCSLVFILSSHAFAFLN